ncbi:nucleic acid-binding, OB-fold protein [Tanacetum coccineum]
MATTNYPDIAAAAKGKMVAIEPEVSNIISLKPTDYNKTIEVIVYRKWVSKHVLTRQATKFCCMLIDKQGTAIQANMDAKDIKYFDQLLELGSAYRITGFSCEHTSIWERTLENPISLAFGKFISVQEIPNANFPEHYFNFASYNELPARLHLKNVVLTDYIGYIQGVSILYTSGNATSNRTHRRIIDIQNLSGNIIRLTLWHEMALSFNVREYEEMEKPVIIAVSSCLVKQFNGLQLSGTSATHYYLNPNIPETYHIKQQYQQLATTVPVLNIDYQRYQNLEAEKKSEPISISYPSCSQPTKLLGDGSGTISLACLSNQPNCLVKDINELLAETPDINPYHLPAALKELEGTTHIFQFHFDVNSTSNRKVFVLDTVFKETVLPLPAPPIALEPLPEQMVFPETMVTPPVDHVPTLPLSNEPPQELPNLSPTEPEPIPIELNAPTSPALSTTASND